MNRMTANYTIIKKGPEDQAQQNNTEQKEQYDEPITFLVKHPSLDALQQEFRKAERLIRNSLKA